MSADKIEFVKIGMIGMVLVGGWNLWPSHGLQAATVSHPIASYDDFPKVQEVKQEPVKEEVTEVEVKFEVTAGQLSRDWANNEVKAAKKYSEPFQLTARIAKVLDQTHVILYVHTNTGTPIAISLKDSENEKAMELNPGAKVTVLCENAGNQVFSIFANNCVFAE